MKLATIFGLLALMVVGLLTTTSLVSAYRGDYSVEGPNCNGERHESMENAFESYDYNVWRELMTENGKHPRVVDVVTESNFETFVRANEAGKNGNYETAATLRAELGLNNGQGPRDGSGHSISQGKGQGMQHNNDGNYGNNGLGQGKGRI